MMRCPVQYLPTYKFLPQAVCHIRAYHSIQILLLTMFHGYYLRDMLAAGPFYRRFRILIRDRRIMSRKLPGE